MKLSAARSTAGPQEQTRLPDREFSTQTDLAPGSSMQVREYASTRTCQGNRLNAGFACVGTIRYMRARGFLPNYRDDSAMNGNPNINGRIDTARKKRNS